ncbi:MAG: hypothetical protein ABJD53_07390 [Gammaproteobacteria bacterium]
MIVSVINLTTGKLTDEAIQSAIRAVNRQVSQDFVPYWGFGGQLRLEGKSNRKRSNATSDMRGDAVLYLCNEVGNSGVDGYHDKTYRGIPYGAVYLELAELLNEAWTVTLSHEALELIGDPEANLLVQGPHPKFPKRSVFHWFEMCDAVQDEQYELDGIAVSNFVLPLYFTSSTEHGGRNDFLGTTVAGKNLRSFGVNPGGYIGFFDPHTAKDGNYEQPDDARAALRLRIKKRLKIGRGVLRKLRTGGKPKR